jgi:hypothetical protein
MQANAVYRAIPLLALNAGLGGFVIGTTGLASITQPTVQRFTSGSGNYVPTSGFVVRIRVRICGGGGGGGALNTNAGSAEATTSFGAWTALAEGGGAIAGGTPGAGGSGGANGTGLLISRIAGSSGVGGIVSSVTVRLPVCLKTNFL